MKVLQINAVYGTGSTGKIAQDIAVRLKEKGHDSHVFWAIRNAAPDENQTRVGNTIDHKLHALVRRLLNNQGGNSRAATLIACRKIEQLKPDVVHLHNLHSNYINLNLLLDFLAKKNYPVLLTLHDCWFLTGYCTHYYAYEGCMQWHNGCRTCPAVHPYQRSAVRKTFDKRCRLYSGIKHLTVNGVSKWTAEAAGKSMLKSASHIECIYNWIDTAVFTPQSNRSEIREKYAVPDGHQLILGVSQGWSDRKGTEEFIQISRELGDKVTVILVGKNNGVPVSENLRCIGFTSNREELISLYSAADLFVNPSRMETFGLVTAEAMACGTPVVAYDNTGSAELVPPECGRLVEDGNADAMTAAVADMLKQDLAAYSDRCTAWVKKNFDKNTQLDKYIKLYELMCSQRAD